MHGKGAGGSATRVYKAGAGRRRIIVAPHRTGGTGRESGPRGGSGTPTAAGRLKRKERSDGAPPGRGQGPDQGAGGGHDGRLKPLPSLLLDTRGGGADRRTPSLFTAIAPGTPSLAL